MRSKYTAHGLDIVELRALWHWLAKRDWFSGPRDKLEWMYSIKQKLTELTVKEKKAQLSKNEIRHSVYDGYGHLQLFPNTDDAVIYKRHDYIVSSLSNTVLTSSPQATAEKAASRSPSSPTLPTPSKPPKPAKYFRTDALGLGLNKNALPIQNYSQPFASSTTPQVSFNGSSTTTTIDHHATEILTPSKPPKTKSALAQAPVIKTRFSMGVVSKSTSRSQEVDANAVSNQDKDNNKVTCELSPVSAFLTQHKKIADVGVDVVVTNTTDAKMKSSVISSAHPNTFSSSSNSVTATVQTTKSVPTINSDMTSTTEPVEMKTPVNSQSAAVGHQHHNDPVPTATETPTTSRVINDVEDSPIALMDPNLSPFSNLKLKMSANSKIIAAQTPNATNTNTNKATTVGVSVSMTPRLAAVTEETSVASGDNHISNTSSQCDDNDENIPPPSDHNQNKANNLNTNFSKSKSTRSNITTPLKPITNNINNNLIVGVTSSINTSNHNLQTPILNVNTKINMSTQKKMSRKSTCKFNSSANNSQIFGFDDDEEEEEDNSFNDENSYNSINISNIKSSADKQLSIEKPSFTPTSMIAPKSPRTVLESLKEHQNDDDADDDDEDDFIPPSSLTNSPMPVAATTAVSLSPIPSSANMNMSMSSNKNKRPSFISRLSIGGSGTGTNNNNNSSSTSTTTRRISASFFKPNPQQQKQNFIKHISSGEASLAKEILASSNNTIQIDVSEASDLLLKCVNNIDTLKEDQETLLLLIDDCHADVNIRDHEGQTPLMTLFTDPILGMRRDHNVIYNLMLIVINIYHYHCCQVVC